MTPPRPARAAALLAAGLALACTPYQEGASWQGYTEAQLAAGGLRTDRMAPDFPLDAAMLERNFVTVALGAEPNPLGLRTPRDGLRTGVLRRWEDPVRWRVVDGSPAAARDLAAVRASARRIEDASGHPVREAGRDDDANLFIFFLRPEDYAAIADDPPRSPGGAWFARIVERFGRTPATPCIASFTATGRGHPRGADRIVFAVILIRANLPPRLAEACVEEEMAQSMGLPNDDPEVRPSIFNDDQQFAHLTRHDAALLRLLYDPRLEAGMDAGEVRRRLPALIAELGLAGGSK